MTITYDQPVDLRLQGSPARGAFNAWFFDTFDRYTNLITGPHKRAAFQGIGAGRILEIGAGTGANFAYLPDHAQLVALEPNEAMHERLLRRAQRLGIEMELLVAPGESIPVADNSIDTVICSLVMCTVSDPDAVLQEIKRVLRPGGTFRFVEHVAAKPISPRRWLQMAIRRPWAWVFEGCQLCRPTADTIQQAGFGSVEIWRLRLWLSVFVPVNSAIYGIATKSFPAQPAAVGRGNPMATTLPQSHEQPITNKPRKTQHHVPSH